MVFSINLSSPLILCDFLNENFPDEANNTGEVGSEFAWG